MKTVQIMILHREWIEVEGRPITFKGFSQYQFILHRTPSQELDHTHSNYIWRVSEATTGLFLAEGATPNAALHDAKQILLHNGVKGIEAGFAKAKKLFADIPLESE